MEVMHRVYSKQLGLVRATMNLPLVKIRPQFHFLKHKDAPIQRKFTASSSEWLTNRKRQGGGKPTHHDSARVGWNKMKRKSCKNFLHSVKPTSNQCEGATWNSFDPSLFASWLVLQSGSPSVPFSCPQNQFAPIAWRSDSQLAQRVFPYTERCPLEH